jgi:hypothetical protein
MQTEIEIRQQGQCERTRLASEVQHHALADTMPQIVWTARTDGWELLLHPDDFFSKVHEFLTALRIVGELATCGPQSLRPNGESNGTCS